MLYTGSDHKTKQHQFNIERLLSALIEKLEEFISKWLEFNVVLTDADDEQTITIPPYYSVDNITTQVMDNDGSLTLSAQNITNNENIMTITINNESDVISYPNYLSPNTPQPFDVKLTMTPITGTNHRLSIKVFAKKRM